MKYIITQRTILLKNNPALEKEGHE